MKGRFFDILREVEEDHKQGKDDCVFAFGSDEDVHAETWD